MKLRVLVIIALSSFVIVALPGTALAAQWPCTTPNNVCIYHDANGYGPWSDYCCEQNDYRTHTFDNQGNFCRPYCWQNDEVSSMDNWDTRWKVRFFVDHNFDGSRETMAVFGRQPQAVYNDAYSSHCWNDGSPQPQTDGNADPDCSGF